jgi:hypothetical protein
MTSAGTRSAIESVTHSREAWPNGPRWFGMQPGGQELHSPVIHSLDPATPRRVSGSFLHFGISRAWHTCALRRQTKNGRRSKNGSRNSCNSSPVLEPGPCGCPIRDHLITVNLGASRVSHFVPCRVPSPGTCFGRGRGGRRFDPGSPTVFAQLRYGSVAQKLRCDRYAAI